VPRRGVRSQVLDIGWGGARLVQQQPVGTPRCQGSPRYPYPWTAPRPGGDGVPSCCWARPPRSQPPSRSPLSRRASTTVSSSRGRRQRRRPAPPRSHHQPRRQRLQVPSGPGPGRR
jgi:hypothetical protein